MSSRPAGAVVPAWLQRAGGMSWRVLVIAALAALLIRTALVLGTVTASVLVALIVAAITAPIMRRLRARGWSQTKAAATITVGVLLFGIGVLVLLALAVLPEMLRLGVAVQEGIAELEAQLADGTIDPGVGQALVDAANAVWSWLRTEVVELAGNVASVVTVGILALFLTFFVLSDGARAKAWVLQAVPAANRQEIDDVTRQGLERVSGFLQGAAAVAAVLSLTSAVILWLLGVPHVIPLAAIAVIGGFVPYLGGILATLVASLAAVAAVGSASALMLAALMLLAVVLAEKFVRPTVSPGSRILHPGVALVVLPAGAALAGIIGFLAAIPVASFVAVAGRAVIGALEPDPALSTASEVSGSIDRLAQWSWRLLAVLGFAALVVFVIGQVPLVVTPIILAAIIAATVAPFSASLRDRGWGATWAALAVTGGASLLILAVVVIATVQLAGPLASAISSSIEAASHVSDDAGGTLAWVESVARAFGGELRFAVRAALQGIAVLILVFVLAALLSFYFVRDAARAWNSILGLVSPWRRGGLDEAARGSVRALGGYMIGTAAISAVGAISQLLIMVILGLPFAVPIAVLSFIAAFIPYIGGFITTGLAFLVAVAYGTPTQIAIMFVYTLVFNIIQGNVVTPLVYNRAVNLHPAVVLLAIPAGGAVAGIVGMFLAVPILAMVAVSWRIVLRVLGNAPADAPVAAADAPLTPAPATEEHAPPLGA
jgi:predicted PurR-regulated permease PerM